MLLVVAFPSFGPVNLPFGGVGAMQKQAGSYEMSSLKLKFMTGSQNDRNQARKWLLAAANESTEKRVKVINILIAIVDSADDEGQAVSFAAWHDAVDLLGRLKAYEAIDVLVRHLDHNDGTIGLSVSHTPTVRALIKIGEPAIPRLAEALFHESALVRECAARTLGGIGGGSARELLERALLTETDEQVRNWLEIELTDVLRRQANRR
jgi:HEAT repeat protein